MTVKWAYFAVTCLLLTACTANGAKPDIEDDATNEGNPVNGKPRMLANALSSQQVLQLSTGNKQSSSNIPSVLQWLNAILIKGGFQGIKIIHAKQPPCPPSFIAVNNPRVPPGSIGTISLGRPGNQIQWYPDTLKLHRVWPPGSLPPCSNINGGLSKPLTFVISYLQDLLTKTPTPFPPNPPWVFPPGSLPPCSNINGGLSKPLTFVISLLQSLLTNPPTPSPPIPPWSFPPGSLPPCSNNNGGLLKPLMFVISILKSLLPNYFPKPPPQFPPNLPWPPASNNNGGLLKPLRFVISILKSLLPNYFPKPPPQFPPNLPWPPGSNTIGGLLKPLILVISILKSLLRNYFSKPPTQFPPNLPGVWPPGMFPPGSNTNGGLLKPLMLVISIFKSFLLNYFTKPHIPPIPFPPNPHWIWPPGIFPENIKPPFLSLLPYILNIILGRNSKETIIPGPLPQVGGLLQYPFRIKYLIRLILSRLALNKPSQVPSLFPLISMLLNMLNTFSPNIPGIPNLPFPKNVFNIRSPVGLLIPILLGLPCMGLPNNGLIIKPSYPPWLPGVQPPMKQTPLTSLSLLIPKILKLFSPKLNQQLLPKPHNYIPWPIVFQIPSPGVQPSLISVTFGGIPLGNLNLPPNIVQAILRLPHNIGNNPVDAGTIRLPNNLGTPPIRLNWIWRWPKSSSNVLAIPTSPYGYKTNSIYPQNVFMTRLFKNFKYPNSGIYNQGKNIIPSNLRHHLSYSLGHYRNRIPFLTYIYSGNQMQRNIPRVGFLKPPGKSIITNSPPQISKIGSFYPESHVTLQTLSSPLFKPPGQFQQSAYQTSYFHPKNSFGQHQYKQRYFTNQIPSNYQRVITNPKDTSPQQSQSAIKILLRNKQDKSISVDNNDNAADETLENQVPLELSEKKPHVN